MEFIESNLGNLLLEVKTGKTPLTNNPNYFNGEIDWYTPGDLKGTKYLSDTDRKITKQAIEENQSFLFSKGTILVSTIGDIGKVGILEQQAASNQQITGLLPNQELIEIELLYYWIIRSKDLLENTANKAVISMLNNKLLKNIKIKFPSHKEDQNLIISKLNKIQDIIDKRQKTIDLMDQFTISRFLEMFGDPVKINTTRPLRKLLHNILSGWSPACEDVKRTSVNDKAVLKQGSISKRNYNALENKLIPDNLLIKKYVPVEMGDVLFSRKNTQALVGSTVFIHETEPNLLIPDTIFKLVYNPEVLNGSFLTYLFNDKNFRKKIQSLANGANQSMIGISQESLLALEIPYPDIQKQNNFGAFIAIANKFRKDLQLSLKSLETLFHSILQNSFRENIQISEIDIFDNIIESLTIDDFKKGDRKKHLINWLGKDRQRFTDFDKYDEAVKKLFELLDNAEMEQDLDNGNVILK